MKKTFDSTAAKLLIAVCLIVLIALWTYQTTTSNLFVWDTTAYLFKWEHRISQLNFENIYWMLTAFEVYNWHPLTWLSWAIDYQLWGGLDSWGYHFSNNTLHAINSVLVFITAIVLFALNDPNSKHYPISTDKYSIIAAFFTAAAFAVHPQHVESVAWVAERKDLLCQLFMLLTLLTYVKYVTCSEKVKTRWYLGTLGMFALALLSKPMAVTLPAILLLIDMYPLRRTALAPTINQSIQQRPLRHLLLEKLPFFALSVAVILFTLFAQTKALSSVSIDLRVFNAFNSIMLYLEKLVIPLHFSPHYPYFLSPNEDITWRAFVPLFSFVAVSFLALAAWQKGNRAWLTAWVFYLIALSPVIGLIQVGGQGAADRYAYFPTLPAYFLLGAGILAALQHSTIRGLATLAVMLSVVTSLAFSARQQVEVWQNPLTLWSQAVLSYPKHVFARNNLAITQLNQGNFESAAYHFEESERLLPNGVTVLAWRGLTYLHLSRYEDAIKDQINLGMAAETMPELKVDQYCIQYNIGWLYMRMDMLEEAFELFSRVDPKSRSGPDAAIWMERLNNIDQSSGNQLVQQELPNFCKTLVPSKVRISGIWQE